MVVKGKVRFQFFHRGFKAACFQKFINLLRRLGFPLQAQQKRLFSGTGHGKPRYFLRFNHLLHRNVTGQIPQSVVGAVRGIQVQEQAVQEHMQIPPPDSVWGPGIQPDQVIGVKPNLVSVHTEAPLLRFLPLKAHKGPVQIGKQVAQLRAAGPDNFTAQCGLFFVLLHIHGVKSRSVKP